VVVYWGMNPIKTDNRHFFLIENFDGEFSDISNTLVFNGFQKVSQSEEIFTYGLGQIQFIHHLDNLDSQFFGGIVVPNETQKIGAKRYLKHLSLIGKFSLFLIIAYTLQWIIAFLAYFADLQWLMDILEFTIPFSLLFSIITAALFVLFGLYFEVWSSRNNQKILKHMIDPFIKSLQSVIPDLEIRSISFQTRIMDRDVMKRLPKEFSEKLFALGIKQINDFYWI